MVVISLHRWALDGHLGSADIVSGMSGRDLELSLAVTASTMSCDNCQSPETP